MIIWALCIVILVESSLETPLRGYEDDGKYGYQYDVKHPGGSSRVHVRSGSDHSRNFYPSNVHHGDYISDSSYNDPTYVGPVYRPNRDRQYPKRYYEEPSYDHTYSKVPVYEEHIYPRSQVYRSAPSHGHFPAHGHDNYRPHGPGIISQSSIGTGSLYQKPAATFDSTYSKPQFIQQVPIQEPIPVKFEQIPLEPIAQTALIKDYSEKSNYPQGKIQAPSFKNYEQTPIDQQVVIDEQSPIDQQVLVDKQSPFDQQIFVEEPAPVSQKVIVDEQSPIDQKVFIDEQSPIDQKILVDKQPPTDQQVIVDEQAPIDQKVVVDEQSPINQQITVDEQSPIDQKVIVDEQAPLDQQIVVEEPKEIILQKTVDEKPELSQISIDIPSTKSIPKVKGTPIVQQTSVDVIPTDNIGKKSSYTFNKPPIVQQVVADDPHSFTKKSPVSQKTIGQPSQAVYDSPVEPYFSDVDHHAPTQSYKTVPKYRIIPSGPPYEKISHFTKIFHAPPRPFYPPRPYYPTRSYPQKHIKSTFPVYKKPPLSYSIKYPPPPPPPRSVTKTVVPISAPYSQKILNTNIFTKNPPVSPSVKLPSPAPAIKTNVPFVQYHVDPPISQSIKLPPPSPVTKSIKLPVLSQVQEPVDENISLIKTPPIVQSVKSAAPPPAIKIITPQVQEHLDADIVHTKNPPVSQTIKSPPPAPITKTLIQANLPQSQELVDSDIISKKNYPPPVSKTVVAVPVSHPQQYEDEAILTKKSPVSQTVKLPSPPVTKTAVNTKLPPPPVTKSIANVKLPPPPVTKSAASVKLPSPPVTKSIPNVKLPPPPVTKSVIPVKQENVDDGLISKKYPSISHSVKTSPVSQVAIPAILPQEQKYIDAPSTKNSPHSVKQPPVQVHHPIIFEKPTYLKEPLHGRKSIGSPQPKLPSVVSYFNKPQYTDPIPPTSYTVKNPYPPPPVLSNKNTHYSDSELHLYVPKSSPSSVKYPITGNAYSVKQPVKSAVASSSPNTPHVNPHFSALLSGDDKGNDHSPSLKQPHSSTQYEPKDTSYPEDGPLKKYSPDFDDSPYPDSIHEEEFGSNIPPDSSHFDEPVEEKSPFDKYSPVSHAVRLPSPKVDSSSISAGDEHTIDGIGESSPLDKYPPVSHSVILPLSPKATPVPNLFAAVPSLPADSDDGTSHDSEISAPKSEALINPVSHSVRLPLPTQGNNYKSHEKSDESKQKFPAFPVESALKQPDPVAEKVAELSNSFTPGEGYDNSNSEPNDSNAPSIEEAKAEIERLNREIGRPFGSRLARRSNSGFVRIR